MRWFDEHKERVAGPETEAGGNNAQEIAKLADETLDGQTMAQFVREFFHRQKSFGEYLGVGKSTVAGWMKTESFPDYAKRATLAAYYANKYWRQLIDARREATRPKIVKDGERYLIVRFGLDDAGVCIGEILARDIPSEKAALVFASGVRAWELLGEAEETLDAEIEASGNEWHVDLREEIRVERARAFNHEKLLEALAVKPNVDVDLGDVRKNSTNSTGNGPAERSDLDRGPKS